MSQALLPPMGRALGPQVLYGIIPGQEVGSPYRQLPIRRAILHVGRTIWVLEVRGKNRGVEVARGQRATDRYPSIPHIVFFSKQLKSSE